MPESIVQLEMTHNLSKTRVPFNLFKTLGRWILLPVLILFLSQSSGAYILQGPHLLQLMTESLGRAKSLQVFQRLVIYNDSLQHGSIQINETLRYILSEAFRSEISSENTRQIQVVESGAALKVIDGKIASESEIGFDRYKDLLLYQSPMLIETILARLGVDSSVSSLGRFQDKIAYVLGAIYPDESVPQLWIDKDSFQPLRWLIRNGSAPPDQGLLDIRYAQWRQFNRMWYPMRVEFYHNGVALREISVDKVLVNPSFPRQLFDIEHLKSIYPPALPAEPVRDETKGVSEVRETIERFRKIFE